LGVSIELHEFEWSRPFEWSRTFHPCSLEICLNLAGSGALSCGGQTCGLAPQTVGFYVSGSRPIQAWRQPGERHHFVTVEFSRPFLRQQLARADGALDHLVEGFVQDDPATGGLGEVWRLTTGQEQLAARLIRPPVEQAARQLWYQGAVLELMAEFLFARPAEDELFCDRQKRLARERAQKVMALLQANLAGPPSLEQLGQKVGCSPFYLSRTFSSEVGMTIPQFLRKVRMERAGELLGSGRYNVTEAALEVGYSSLSHFSQAFCQTMGCCPVLYPLRRDPSSEAQT
jgi:AraC-like DNA-binding protein